ncbi:MAG TPA: response regulator [Anaeromyxobacteraceae bacterium]|nr:response regulator [Anaeromyxobacteraceae bacterium]
MARVLIVDDTDIVRRALELALRKMGHEAVSTSDALLALELALAHPPDLALLDYRMPGMDGVTLFAELRRALGERCPKVLFVSATPPEEVRARMQPPASAVGYVRKPFHLDDLSRVVKEALAA